MNRSIENEAAVLGAVLLDNAVFPQTAALCPDDFSLNAHRLSFARMRELERSGRPIDMVTLAEELSRHEELETVGGVAFLSSLIDGVPERSSIEHYVGIVRQQAGRRLIGRTADAISKQSENPSASIPALRMRLSELERHAGEYEAGDATIRQLADIPDIFTFDGAVDYLVQDLFPRSSLSLLTGAPGVGKSFLALKLAMACTLGSKFIGHSCERVGALYLDKENPLALIKSRLDVLAHGAVPELKVWGNWVADDPPMIGDVRLLNMAVQGPLIVFDSFVRFHVADENSATEMRSVMEQLRRLADTGATVLVLHHRSKAEGNKYRGSSDILAGVDLAYSLEQADEGLLQLHRFKSRFSGETTITINADFAGGHFEMTESPTKTQRRDDLAAITEVITAEPGITQSAIIERLHIGRTKVSRLLAANEGKLWRIERGQRSSLRYFSMTCTEYPAVPGTPSTGSLRCTAVPAPLGAVQGTARMA